MVPVGLGGQDKVLSADFIESALYLVIQRADGVSLDAMNIEPGTTDTGHTLRGLHRPAFPNDPSKKVGVRYATGTGGDEFALPWGVPAEETIHVVCLGNDGNAAGRLQSRKVLINDAETGY